MELQEFKEKMQSLGAWENFEKELIKYGVYKSVEEFLFSIKIDTYIIASAFRWDNTEDGDDYWFNIETKFDAICKN